MPQFLEFCGAKLRKTKPPPARRPAVLIARFLRSKNRKLKNGRDAAIPGVLRSKTPKDQNGAKRLFGPRKG
jgi:hypothetical protein